MSCLVSRFDTADALSDLPRGLGPSERRGVQVPVNEVLHDLAFQGPDVIEASAANRFVGDPGEPALDQIQP